ncbi:hypothetical protein D9758_013591 [Tetrapyrgos nigripes]|uniref:Sodium/calcium exchanger membrane region domain-containing protein n=1 Tax=Tetrapyrgos nigripes TaxID=182062 RepID=A0A8H5CB55_9AGAR|nr:hypothetical protein D9758_013591 [Tetrapyrgos nigripes]
MIDLHPMPDAISRAGMTSEHEPGWCPDQIPKPEKRELHKGGTGAFGSHVDDQPMSSFKIADDPSKYIRTLFNTMSSVYFEEKKVCNGVLRPVAAHCTGRYDKWSYAKPKSGTISRGFMYTHEAKEYLPPNWSSHVHPEGQLYFAREGPLRVVTEVYMYNQDLMNKVLSWVSRIEALLEEKKFPLSEGIELFVMLEEDDCLYYFVNHTTREQFWLEEVQSEDIGIPDSYSPSHLKLYLEELYWWHWEHFPMHHPNGLPVHLIDELICVFSHALTDHMTSNTSTFFYGQEDCKKILKVLRLAREHPTDDHQTCVVARLWKFVCSNRFQTHYGQESSRLSRDQHIIYDPSRPSRISRIAATLTFKHSGRYLTKLKDIFVDHLVYETEWKPFMAHCFQDWKGASSDDPSKYKRKKTLRPSFSLQRAVTPLLQPERKLGEAPVFFRSLKSILFSSWLNALLVFILVSWAFHFANPDSPTLIFVFSFLAMIPLAKLLAFATDELAMRVGQTLAGLLSATLGNAIELIVAIIALTRCNLQLVQSSLVGSILSNLLLVLGMCFFAGGVRFSEQGFGAMATQLNSSLLTISVIAVLLPAAFHFSVTTATDSDEPQDVLKLSHGVALILLFIYGSYLFFQLYSHATLYDDKHQDNFKSTKYEPRKKGQAEGSEMVGAEGSMANNVDAEIAREPREEGEEEEQPQMNLFITLVSLAVVTVPVAVTAEWLVDSIDGLVESSPISEVFIGVILLPIVGNAAEHVTAVTVSMKDKLTLCLGVAVGSSIRMFANMRGNRIRSSSFVFKSHSACSSNDYGPQGSSSLFYMAPTLMAGAVSMHDWDGLTSTRRISTSICNPSFYIYPKPRGAFSLLSSTFLKHFTIATAVSETIQPFTLFVLSSTCRTTQIHLPCRTLVSSSPLAPWFLSSHSWRFLALALALALTLTLILIPFLSSMLPTPFPGRHNWDDQPFPTPMVLVFKDLRCQPYPQPVACTGHFNPPLQGQGQSRNRNPFLSRHNLSPSLVRSEVQLEETREQIERSILRMERSLSQIEENLLDIERQLRSLQHRSSHSEPEPEPPPRRMTYFLLGAVFTFFWFTSPRPPSISATTNQTRRVTFHSVLPFYPIHSLKNKRSLLRMDPPRGLSSAESKRDAAVKAGVGVSPLPSSINAAAGDDRDVGWDEKELSMCLWQIVVPSISLPPTSKTSSI